LRKNAEPRLQARARKNNEETAKDIAAMTVNEGVLLYGVNENRRTRVATDIATVSLAGVEEKLRLVAGAHGALAITDITTVHVEALACEMLADDLSPKTIRNVLSFLHATLEHAIDRGWVRENPVRRATGRGAVGLRRRFRRTCSGRSCALSSSPPR
jgi:hypothetical protein